MIHFKIDPEKYGRVNFWSLEGYEILIFENLCDLLFQKSRMDQWVGVHSEYTQYYRPSPPEPFHFYHPSFLNHVVFTTFYRIIKLDDYELSQ